MKITVIEKKEVEVKYLKVSATVRYWDDATVNGDQDESGKNVPFKNDTEGCPVIDIENGIVLDWPNDTEASFHFKVCDAGTYWLLDKNKNEVAEILNNYVPSGLCHGDQGFGDYIIFSVNKDGSIADYSNNVDPDDWSYEDCQELF